MEYISSKNIFMLTRDMLKLINRKLMDHGSRVAYILSMMLHEADCYEEYEIAEFCYLASFHDIGAYKTEDLSKFIQFETRDGAPHSIYGYLFFKHLSPFENRSKILLYHHTLYSELQDIDFEYKDIANYLNLADAVDIYMQALREKFNIEMFRRWAGKRFSNEALELLMRAEEKEQVIENIRSGNYKKVLDAQMEYFILTNQEKRKSLELLMYCGGFYNVEFVVGTTTCICISYEIAERLKLSREEETILYYGALLHDIGVLMTPKEILEAPRKLTDTEMDIVRRHIPIEERIFKMRDLNEDILNVAIAHHERKDGSGYPKKLKGKECSRLQRILQVADSVTGMLAVRAYREPLHKEQIITILKEESESGKYDKEIVNILLEDYDNIMEKVKEESEAILSMHTKFRKISAQFT